jgi:hypothetical protein
VNTLKQRLTFEPVADDSTRFRLWLGADRIGVVEWTDAYEIDDEPKPAGWWFEFTSPRTGKTWSCCDAYPTLPEAFEAVQQAVATMREREGRSMVVPRPRVVGIPAGGASHYRRR